MAEDSRKRKFEIVKGFCEIPGHGGFDLKIAVSSKGDVFKSTCPKCKDIIKKISNIRGNNEVLRVTKKFCSINGHGEYYEKKFKHNNDHFIITPCPKCEDEVNKREPELKMCKNNPDHGEYLAEYMGPLFSRTPGKSRRNPCPKCAADRNEREKKQAEFQFRLKVKEARDRASIPELFQKCTADNYNIECEEQEHAVFIAKHYISEFIRNGKGLYNLIFYGIPGNGKTHLAAAIMNALINKGFTARYLSMFKYLNEVRSTYSYGTPIATNQIFAFYAGFDLLVLDEVGVGQINSESERGAIYNLINARYEKQLPTLIITNGPKDIPDGVDTDRLIDDYLDEHLTRKVLDRLKENGCEYMWFNWGSYRLRKAN